MIATGLAEWIINDTCLVYFYSHNILPKHFLLAWKLYYSVNLI